MRETKLHTIISLFAIVAFFSICLPIEASAQYRRERQEVVNDVVYRDVVKKDTLYKEGFAYVQFQVGKSDIVQSYANNSIELDKIRNIIRGLQADRNSEITKITIVGYGSPEGAYSYNEKLANERSLALSNYIRYDMGISLPTSVQYVVKSVPEDWEGLKKLVSESYDTSLPKGKIISIIDNVPIFDGREKELMDIDYGAVYKTLLKTMFPQLRRAYYRVDYITVGTKTAVQADTVKRTVTLPGDTVNYSSFVIKTKKRKIHTISDYSSYFGIRTNALYLAVGVPNFGVDFNFGKKVSLTLEGAYASWTFGKIENPDFKTEKKKYAIWNGSGELRYWFGSTKGGHFIGVHGGMGDYNFKFNEIGKQGTYYGGGVVYGYSFPIVKRFNIEVEVGAGYVKLDGNEYEYRKNSSTGMPDGVSIKKVNKNYFGPTKAAVSLVYKF